MHHIRAAYHKTKALFAHTDTTNTKVARGSVVLVLGRFLLKGVQFVRTIVLAHLLFPDDFGLFGLASLALGVTSAFFVSGLNASLVQTKDHPDQYLDAIWTVSIIRNALLAALIFLVAPLAGAFFARPDVIALIRVLALSVFIDGFANIGLVLLQRDLHFNKKFLFDVSTVFLEVVSVIIAALILHSAWALVIGAIANRLIGVALSYLFSPYRPSWTWDLRPALKLFKYGKWVSYTAILIFFIGQGDNMTVGKLLNTEELGYYQLAFTLAFLPAMEFSRVMGNILFPFFSRIKEDKEQLLRTFVKIGRIMFAVATPMSFGLLAVLPTFIATLYGERWLPMLPIVNVLLIYGFARSFEYLVNPLLMGIGRPETAFYAQVLQFFGMFAPIVPLTHHYGAVGTAWSVVIGGVLSICYLLYIAMRSLRLRFGMLVEMLGVSTIASLVMYLIIIFMRDESGISGGLGLTVELLVGAVSYVGTLFVVDALFGGVIRHSLIWIKKNL